jgi:hypothetical protein
MRRGFLYLVAVIDLATRKVLSWWVSNTMDVAFRLEALEEAMIRFGKPESSITDQGSKFTSPGSRFADRRRDTGLNGRTKPMKGQRIYRTFVAQPEIWLCLSVCVRNRIGTTARSDKVDRLLQQPKTALQPGSPNARRGIHSRQRRRQRLTRLVAPGRKNPWHHLHQSNETIAWAQSSPDDS